VSYALPLLVCIIARLSPDGEQHRKLEGPYSLGRWGLLANIVGFVYLAFAVITFNFPTVKPVDEENMNYTSAAVGVVMVIALITWITTGRKHYSGPETGVVMEGVEGVAEGVKREGVVGVGEKTG
ncbi:Choline transport protein, partial [Lasiodiplodia hormozganensis]